MAAENTSSRGIGTWISPEIRVARRHGRPIVDYVLCPACGISFGRTATMRAKAQRFCSQACKGAASSKRVERRCKQCGNQFLVRRYSADQGWGTFCSNACQYQYQRDHAEELFYTGQYLTCRHCGKRFYHHQREDGRHFGYFCSRTCSAANSEGKGRRSRRSRSGYRGVYPRSDPSPKWAVEIRHHGKLYYFGSYVDPEAAARAYDREARRLQGEHAILNFPDKDDPGAKRKD